MKMFLGEYQPTLIESCRIALPVKIREQIKGKEVVLSRGFEKCLFGYEKSDWELEAQKEIQSPISDSKTRKLKRYLFSGAANVALDSQGRFVIPTALKDYAGLKDKVTVIGAGDHFEIWETNRWQVHLKSISEEVVD
jgi:MraZ protein